MRTIIAGSRTCKRSDVHEAIAECPWTSKISVVLSGCALGADTYGEEWAESRNLQVERYPADWKAYGKAAGSIRNRQMAKKADALVAVWDGQSRGTQNMIEEARSRELQVFVYRLVTNEQAT